MAASPAATSSTHQVPKARVDDLELQTIISVQEHDGFSTTSHPRQPQTVPQVIGPTDIYLTWEDLWVTVSTGKKESLPILQGLSGYTQSGQVLAIMGPSGCGKSSLLDSLEGRLDSNTRQYGQILVNGRKQRLAFGIWKCPLLQQQRLLLGIWFAAAFDHLLLPKLDIHPCTLVCQMKPYKLEVYYVTTWRHYYFPKPIQSERVKASSDIEMGLSRSDGEQFVRCKEPGKEMGRRRDNSAGSAQSHVLV